MDLSLGQVPVHDTARLASYLAGGEPRKGVVTLDDQLNVAPREIPSPRKARIAQ